MSKATKLTASMRRVLERMAKGELAIYNPRTGYAVWGKTGARISESKVGALLALSRAYFVLRRPVSGWHWSELVVFKPSAAGRKTLKESR